MLLTVYRCTTAMSKSIDYVANFNQVKVINAKGVAQNCQRYQKCTNVKYTRFKTTKMDDLENEVECLLATYIVTMAKPFY